MKRSVILKKVKAWTEPLRFVVVQVPDYNGGWRIEFFGYTKTRQKKAMEIADRCRGRNFVYVLDLCAREGDVYDEHYEPSYDDPQDFRVVIDVRKAQFILK